MTSSSMRLVSLRIYERPRGSFSWRETLFGARKHRPKRKKRQAFAGSMSLTTPRHPPALFYTWLFDSPTSPKYFDSE